MKKLIFDIETNGFLNKMTKIHCLVIREYGSEDYYVFRHNDEENNIADGIAMLMEADWLIGHNIVRFDIPAIQKIYPDFQPKARVRDTLITSKVVFSDQKKLDYKFWKKKSSMCR